MTKQVQLSDEAYERLRRAKRPGDSFSDVVCRHFRKESLLDLVGTRTPEDCEAHLRLLGEARALDAMREKKLERWWAGDFP